MSKQISILVCAYNEEADIDSCLSSLVKQKNIDGKDYEIIVIDDGSTDETGSICKRFINTYQQAEPQVKYARIRHMGLSVARNTGLYLADSPIVAYTDADAEAEELWLSNILETWQHNQDAQAVGGSIIIRNRSSFIAKALDAAFYNIEDKKSLIGANMSFRKETLVEAGGFAPVFKSRGDESFVCEKISPDIRIIQAPSAIVRHDRPHRIGNWIKERYSNGKMTYLIAALLNRRERQWFFHSVSRLSLCLIPLLIIFAGYYYAAALLIGYSLFVALRVPVVIQRSDKSNAGVVQIPVGIILKDIGKIAANIGIIAEALKTHSGHDKDGAMEAEISGMYIEEQMPSTAPEKIRKQN